MVYGGTSMAIASISTFITNWSTPTILFCFLNFMIGIIYLASNSKYLNHHRNIPLPLPPALLERVKAVSLSSFYGSTPDSQDDHYGAQDHDCTTGNNSVSRPPSLSQRVKTFNFSFSTFYADSVVPQPQQESERTTRYDSPGQLVARVPLLERVKLIKFSSYTQNQNRFPTESEETGEARSLLDRLKSFKLITLPFNSDNSSLSDSFPSQDQDSDMDHHHSVPSKIFDNGSSMVSGSKSEKSSETPMERSLRNLTRTHSEKRKVEVDDDEEDVDQRRPATMRAAIGGSHEECVNTKADDFIKRFKQQLKLQRMDSLERFRDMLNRGT